MCAFPGSGRDVRGMARGWWTTWSRCYRRSGGGSRGRDRGVKCWKKMMEDKKYKVDFWDLVNPQFMTIL